MLRETLCAILLVSGALLMTIAALGIVRMPDLYMRMSASSKASTLGLSLIVLAAMIYFDDLGTQGRALAVIAFIMLTTPVAAHLISRAGYLTGAKLWPRTLVDQLKGCYAPGSHRLASRSNGGEEEARKEPEGGREPEKS